jgi:diguanylate cyclase (GGDEF)-like protein/PAS domain S-box-containing protein
VAYHPYREAGSRITGIVASLRDITDAYVAQEQLRLAASVFESTMEGVIITDDSANIIAVNPAFSEITGYAKEEVLGHNPRLLKSGRHDEIFYQSMWAAILTTGRWRGELWNRNRAGEVFPAWLTISSVNDSNDVLTHYVATFSDISALKHSEEKLNHLAHHDALTDLPNRLLLDARLNHCIEQAQRDKSNIALLFLDLDEFKHINDGLGHPVGDEVLKKIASRLHSRVRADDTVARLGGDEFVVAMGRVEAPRDAALLAEEILVDIAQPINTGPQELFVTGSIGISLYPQDGRDITTLLRNADAAMYRAKEQGRNNYQFYTTRYTADAFERMRLQADMQRALENQEFVLHYQPQFVLSDGRLAGVEVLVRWRHPKLGLVSPTRFIALAEQTGQIVALGDWVLRNACEQWVRWRKQGLSIDHIAVNLSLRQIHESDLVRNIAKTLEQTGCPPQHLELEITEGVIMREEDHALKVLEGLRSLGVSLSIDDFGTGYSSLSYLKRMPVGKLKIDRSFVRDIPEDPEDAAISRAVIALGKSLQLVIIAEGVENNAQLNFMHNQGCDQAQGYLFSQPLAAKKFEKFLKKHT